MHRSETIAEIAAALAAFNAEVKNPPKDQHAEVKSKKGEASSYSYNYADLAGITEATRPLLAAHGLSVVQDIIVEETRVAAVTTILHSSGEWLEYLPLWMPAGPEAQDYTAGITTSRRVALMAALNLGAAEDPEARTRDRLPRGAGGDKATTAQQNKIRVLAGAVDLSESRLVTTLKRDYQAESLPALTKQQASDLIERLLAQEKRRAAAAAAGADPETGEMPAENAGEDPDAGRDFWPKDGAPGEPPDDDDGPVPGMDAEQARRTWERPAKAQEGLLS